MILCIPVFASQQILYDSQVAAIQYGWSADLHWQVGEQLARRDDWRGAVAHWESANPQTPDQLARLVDAYMILQRWDDAITRLRQIITLQPDHTWAHYHLALLIAPSNPLEAEQHLMLAQRSDTYTDDITTLLDLLHHNFSPVRLGLWFSQQERWDLAEHAFYHAALIGDPVAAAYVALAREQQNKNGADWMTYALDHAPQNAQVYYVYGLYLRQIGDLDESVSAFITALTFDPFNPAYNAELGVAYQRVGAYFNAENMFRLAVQYSDNDPLFAEMLAAFYAQEGYRLTPDRLERLQQSRANLPPDPTLRAGFGWALHQLGDSAGGLIEVEAALALEPDNEQALYYKAQILIDMGNIPAAIPILQRLAAQGSTWAQDTLTRLPEVTDEPE
ncbi:MAG: hypothetical protein CUN56_11370 [Phototrophicales bacterium]|nr:MAG: hypothetical protein CUN56_11370 [Phototrophicales bacterium]